MFMNFVLRLKTIGGNSFPPQTRYGKLVDVLASQGRMVDIYQVSYALYTRSFLAELGRSLPELDAPWGLPPERRVELEKLIEGSSELHAISLLELSCFIGERLLRDTDTASMAVALEVRVPLLDHEVVERTASLATGDRYSPIGKKQLLRDLALSDLDPEIFDRPKSGFVLPIERWSRAALRSEIEAALTNRAYCEACGLDPESVVRLWRAYEQGTPGIYWSRIWAIFVLLRWTTRHRMSL
jgi:asparagine synthase (glutamine-hydrolysing)